MPFRRSFYRPPLGRGTKLLLIVNSAAFLLELLLAYGFGFDPLRLARSIRIVGLSLDRVSRGWIWQVFTYMWIHDPDHITHIGFNMIVLYFFGPAVEASMGTKTYITHYLLYGLGGAVLFLGSAGLAAGLWGHPMAPAIGASGAIAGVVTVFCILHWRDTLSILFFQLKGRTLLIVFVAIDLLRLLLGEPIAVQAHWGGMLAAALLLRPGAFDPRRLWMRLKHYRLRRRLRLHRSDRSDDDRPTLH